METYNIYFGLKNVDLYESAVIEALNLQEAEDIARLYAIDLYEKHEVSKMNEYERGTWEYLQERESSIDYGVQA